MDKCKYKKRKSWSANQEETLIQLWEQNIEKLRTAKKSNHIFKEIEAEMAKSNMLFSAEEIKIKLHNLTNKYRKEKNAIGTSGGSPLEWPMYEKVNEILGAQKIHNIEVLMEDNIMKDCVMIDILDDDSGTSNQMFSPSSSSSPSPVTPATPSDTKVVSSRSAKRKVKNLNEDLLKEFKRTNDLIQHELESVNKMEQKSANLEEKRTKLLENFVVNSKDFQAAILNLLSHNK